MEKEGKRLAVLVGCNYPNTKNALHGCHNDVLAMRDILVSRFQFDPINIEILIDKPGAGSSVMPTAANIRNALNRMVGQAVPADVLYFHYSGHGTLIHDKPFFKEEAIVPTDFNLITNVDFRNLVNRVPKGATLTILSDSCHSGGLIDKEKEQIGPSSHMDNIAAAGDEDDSLATKKLKAIPFESILDHLSSLTNINTTDIGTHLLEIFGVDASLRFRLPAPMDQLFLKPLKPDQGILLSGCQTDETSADVWGSGGKAFGAFSNAVQQVLKQNPQPLTNTEFVSMARKILSAQRFDQHPCLYCSDENANATFLCQSPNSSI